MDTLKSFLQVDISPLLGALRELQERVDKQDRKIEEQRQVIEASKEFQASTRILVQQFKGSLDQVTQRLASVEEDVPNKFNSLRNDLNALHEKHSELTQRCDTDSGVIKGIQQIADTVSAKTDEALANIPRVIQHETSAFAANLREQQEVKFQQISDIINARQELVFDRVRAVETTLQNMPDQESFDAAAQNTAELEGIVRKSMGEITKLQLSAGREHDRVTSLEDSLNRLKQMVSSRFASQGTAASGVTPLLFGSQSTLPTQEEIERDRMLAQFDLGDSLLMTSEARRERADKTRALVKAGALPSGDTAAGDGIVVAGSGQSGQTPGSTPSTSQRQLAQVDNSTPASTNTTNMDWIAAREMDTQTTAKKLRELEDRLLDKLVEHRTEMDADLRAESVRVQQRFAGLARVLKGLHARVGELDTKRFSGMGMPGSRGSMISSTDDSRLSMHELSRDLAALTTTAPPRTSISEKEKSPTDTNAITLPPIHGSSAQQQPSQQPLTSGTASSQQQAQQDAQQTASEAASMPVPPPVRQLGYQPPAGLKGLAAKRLNAQHGRSASMITGPETSNYNSLNSHVVSPTMGQQEQQLYESQLIQSLSVVAAREAEIMQNPAGNIEAQLLKRYIDVGLKDIKDRLRKLEHGVPVGVSPQSHRESSFSVGATLKSIGQTPAPGAEDYYSEAVGIARQYTDAWAGYFLERLNAVEADLVAFGVTLPSLKELAKQATPAALTASDTESASSSLRTSPSTVSLHGSSGRDDLSARDYRQLLNKLRKELATMVQRARVELAGAVLGPGAVRLIAEPRLEQQRAYLQSAAAAAAADAGEDAVSESEGEQDEMDPMKSSVRGAFPSRGKKTEKTSQNTHSPQPTRRKANSRSRSRSRSPANTSRVVGAGVVREGDTTQVLSSSSSSSQLLVAPVSSGAQSRGVSHFAASGLVVHKGPTKTLVGEDGKLYKGRQADAVIFSPPSNSISGHFFTSVSRTPPGSPKAPDSAPTPVQSAVLNVHDSDTQSQSVPPPQLSAEGSSADLGANLQPSEASPSVVLGKPLGKPASKPRPIASQSQHHTSQLGNAAKAPHGPKALVASLSTSGLLAGLNKR